MGIIKKITVISALFLISAAFAFAQANGEVDAPAGSGTVESISEISEKVPQSALDAAKNFITGKVGASYFSEKIKFLESRTFQKSGGEIFYSIFYEYSVPEEYLDSPAATYISVEVSKPDNRVIRYIGPEKAYKFSITKEQAIKVAEEQGIKGPFTAFIDIAAIENVGDVYAWVVTGALDPSTCRAIQGMEECFYRGAYVDVDSGELIALFQKSNLIAGGVPGGGTYDPIGGVGGKNGGGSILTTIIIVIAIILILVFVLKRKKQLNP